MKLLNVKSARAVWLVDLQDLNPKGKNIAEDLVSWIKDKYSFAEAPSSEAIHKARLEQGKHGLKFRAGRFLPTAGDAYMDALPYHEINLEVYSDGLVAETFSSTDHGDEFIERLLESAAAEMDLYYDPSLVRSKLYVSEIHFKSDASLELLNPRLRDFSERLTQQVARRGHFMASSLGFWTDPGMDGGHLTFSLERQNSKNFAQNRYFSSAPVQTHIHFGLLEELERILTESQ